EPECVIFRLTEASSRAKRHATARSRRFNAERSLVMRKKKAIQAVVASALFHLLIIAPSFAIENIRVAYPSMNTSVFSLLIAQKEGYFKEEGLNIELLSIRGE